MPLPQFRALPQGTRRTLHVRNQLTCHNNLPIDALCFNSKRNQILTADRYKLTLFSLRKELKRVNLVPPQSKDLHALIVALVHNVQQDVYTAVFGGDPRVVEHNHYVHPAVVRVYHSSLAVLLQFSAHQGPILAATFNQNRCQLVTSSTTAAIRVWNFDSANSSGKNGKDGKGDTNPTMMATSVDAGGSGVQVILGHILEDHDRPVGVLHVASCGKLLIGSGGTDVWIWNMGDGVLMRCIRSLHNFQTELITAMIYTTRLDELTLGYDDGVIAVWRIELISKTHNSQQQKDQRQNVASTAIIAVNTSSSLAAAPSTSAITVNTNKLKRPTLLREFESHEGRVHGLALSDDRRWIFSCGVDGMICHHDALHGSRLGGLRCSSIVRAAFTGVRREYPPSIIRVQRVRAPFGTRLLIFSVTGAVINIVDVQSPQWECKFVRESVMGLRRRRVDGVDLVAAVLSNNQIHVLDGTTGTRARQTIAPPMRTLKDNVSNKKKTAGSKGLRRRMHGSASTGSIETSQTGTTLRPTKLARGRVRLGATTAKLPPAVETGGGERSSSIGNLHSQTLMPTLLVSEWWDERDAVVLGWSDGAVEVSETKHGGRRLKLMQDKTQQVAITSVCVAKLSCTSGDRAVAAGSGGSDASNVPQKIAEQAWANNEVGTMTVHAPISELAGPWGGPVRFQKSKKRKKDGKQKMLDQLESKYTIVVGNSQGTLCVWSPRLNRLISSNHGHSGAIVGVVYMPTNNNSTNATTSAPKLTLEREQHQRILSCAPSPSRDCLVSASMDGVVKVWSVSRAGKLKQISFFLAQPYIRGGGGGGRRSALTQIMVIPGTSILVCGFDEGTIQAWKLDTESRVNVDAQQLEARTPFWNRNQHSQKVTAIRSSEHAERFATSSLDATIVIWELTTRRKTLSKESVGKGGLMLHITPLQAFSVDSPVIDLSFVGDGGALLAVLSGRLVWLDGTLRAIMDQRKAALEDDETRQEVLRAQYWNQQNEPAADGDTPSALVVGAGGTTSNNSTERQNEVKEEEEERWPESDAESSSSSSSEEEEEEEEIAVKTSAAFPYSGYQPIVSPPRYKPRSVSIGSNSSIEHPPVAFLPFGDRSEIPVASIPSRHSPPPSIVDSLQSPQQNRDGVGATHSRSIDQHFDSSIDSPTFFALLPEMTAEFVPHTRGSLRPFTADSNDLPMQSDNHLRSSSRMIRRQEQEQQIQGASFTTSLASSNVIHSPVFSAHASMSLSPPSMVVPISGRPLPDMTFNQHDSQTTLIFQLLEAEMTSLDPSEEGQITLTDIPRLLMSMQQTSRENVDNQPVLRYPLWLILELYQRLIRWKLTVSDATRNAVKAPTVSQDLKRIQQRCDNTRVDLEITKRLFTALLAYGKRHKIHASKQKTFLRRSNKQSKQIVEYNVIGEKKITNRTINVSEMVSFRQMFVDMRSRDQRARAASREQWDQMLGTKLHNDEEVQGLSRIPPVRWHIIPHETLELLDQFGKSLHGGSTENDNKVSHWPWPALPEVFIKQHTQQLKTLPKQDRDKFNLPTFDEVSTMPLHVVLELIRQILEDKEADDMVQDRQSHPRQGLCMFIYEWHLQSFGLPVLVAKRVVGFLRSLLDYREVPVCRTLARFCRILGEVPTSETVYGNSNRHASSSLNMYLDAKQWFHARDAATRKSFSEPLGNLMGMEPSRMDISSALVSATSTAHYQVPLVTLYRAFECIRALFPGHLPLVRELESSLVNLPSMSDVDHPNLRLVEMELVLEAFLQQYGQWIHGASNRLGGSNNNGLKVSVPSSNGSSSSSSSSSNITNTDPSLQANDSQSMAFVVSAVKRLLDDMMLADETATGSAGNRSGSLSPSSFEDTLSSSAIWGSQTLPPSLLRTILKEFERDGSIAYLEFWSQLYQYVTTHTTVPLHMPSDDNGTVILPLSVLENLRKKKKIEKGVSGAKNTTALYSNMVSTGGHGKSTVPVPLKGLTDRMAAMVPLFSTNLNMSMTSTTSANASSIFHNGTIELSSTMDLTPGVSRAPARLERSDKMQHKRILDHGEHSRHAIKPPPRQKHPSSQKRMNMTLLHHNSVERIRSFEDSKLATVGTGATSSSLSMVDLSTWSNDGTKFKKNNQSPTKVTHGSSQLPVNVPSPMKSIPLGILNPSNVVERISRAVTPSLHLRARRAINACLIVEQDQRESALFSIDRNRTVSHYMLTLRLLLEDADARQIRNSEPNTKSAQLTEADTRTLTKVISGAYKIPANKRKAAKSVLSTATTKAEAVSIEIALLSGSEPIDIIRASDDVLHTAVTIDIDEKLRTRFLRAIEMGSDIINALVPQKRKRVITQFIEARSTSSLLSIVYQLLLHGFNDEETSVFDRVDDEGTVTERSRGLLVHAVRRIPSRCISTGQRKSAITALNDVSTMTEACVILVAVLEGQQSTVVSEQARTTKDHISELAESIRTASRASSRTQLSVLETPNLRHGVGTPPATPPMGYSSRPNSRSSEVSSRLYPDAYKSGPPQWDSAQPRPNSRGNSLVGNTSPPGSTQVRSRPSSRQDVKQQEGMGKSTEFSTHKRIKEEREKVQDPSYHQHDDTRGNQLTESHDDDDAVVILRVVEEPFKPSNMLDKEQPHQAIVSVSDSVVLSPENGTLSHQKDTDQKAEHALFEAAERARQEQAVETSARSKRDARRAEKEAALRAEVDGAQQLENDVDVRAKQAVIARSEANKISANNAEIEAQNMAAQFEDKVRKEMAQEAKERERLAMLASEKQEDERKRQEQKEQLAREQKQYEDQQKQEEEQQRKMADAKKAAQVRALEAEMEVKEKENMKIQKDKEAERAKIQKQEIKRKAREDAILEEKRKKDEKVKIKAEEMAEKHRALDAADAEFENQMKLKVELKVAEDMAREKAEKEKSDRIAAGKEEEQRQRQEELAQFATKMKLEEEIKAKDRAERAQAEAERELAELAKKQHEKVAGATVEDDSIEVETNFESVGESMAQSLVEDQNRLVSGSVVLDSNVSQTVIAVPKEEDNEVVKTTEINQQESETRIEAIQEPANLSNSTVVESTIATQETETVVSLQSSAEITDATVEDVHQKEETKEDDTEDMNDAVNIVGGDNEDDGKEEEEEKEETPHFLANTHKLLEEQQSFMASIKERKESEKLVNERQSVEELNNWYSTFQSLCVSDEEESDGMDSGNDEFGLGAVSIAQYEADQAKKHANEIAGKAKEATQALMSSREKALAEKAAKEAAEKAAAMQEELEKILLERRKREERRRIRMKNKEGPRKRAMVMKGLKPEYGLTFSDNIEFDPFQLMKGPTSIPPWEEGDAIEESDGYDSEEEKQELNEWKITRNRVIRAAGTEKLKSMMSGVVEDILPASWETAPRMFKMEQPLWRPWFRREEEDLLHEVEVVEEQELDVMAKRLAEQKAALLAGEVFDEKEEEERKGRQERAKGHWGKIRVHVKTKWRMSKMLRKARMKTTAVRPVASGVPINDVIPKGRTKDDDLSAFKYYSLQIDSEHSIITVNITSSQGDPDLYVSNHILPSTVDYTWKVNTIGKCRLVIFPSDPNFVTGKYLIGVYSSVPARFQVLADVSGGAYSSESVRNVERLTQKFNTVAEGFVVKRVIKEKPKSKVRLKKIAQTPKERAEAYLRQETDAEARLSVLRQEVESKVQKISTKRLRHIARLEEALERSTQKRDILASQFVVQDNGGDTFYPTSADDEMDDDEDEYEDEYEDQRDLKLASAAEHIPKSSEPVEQGATSSTQSIAEILKALEAAESDSSEEDDDEPSEFGQSDALRKVVPDPISLWRPKLALTKATRFGFEAKNTFESIPRDTVAELQKYELKN